MAEKIHFELVSPERLLVSEPVDMVVVPGSEGDFGALPRHAPMLTTVRPGIIDVYENGAVRDRIFVAGGFCEVNEERCTVLAEEAVPVADLTPEAVKSRLDRAQTALEEADSDIARAAAEKSLAVARAMNSVLGQSAQAH